MEPFMTIVFPTERSDASTRYAGFARRLKKAGGFPDIDVLTVALENLVFIVNEAGEAHVIDSVSGRDIGDSQFVYLKSWEAMPEEASALTNYLFFKGIPCIDTAPIGMGVSKLATTFRLWAEGIKVPFTLYVRRSDRLEQILHTEWAMPLDETFIVKDIVGAKGKLNFLVNRAQAIKAVTDYPDTSFLCQRYVQNDGDFRVGVYVDEPSFIIRRVGSGDTHLNNVSAGGKAQYIPLSKASSAMKSIAQHAARAVDLQIAGVDMIRDAKTRKWYVLEVNQGSQIVTGAYVNENIQAFNARLSSVMRNRIARVRKRPTKIIGRRTSASLSDLGVTRIIGKVDTGAYSSSLHAENIRVTSDSEGDVLHYDIVPDADRLETVSGGVISLQTRDFFTRLVKSSNGQEERRFSIRTKITIQGITFPAIITLSDRSHMSWPLLIGRRLVRSRFIVNVELDQDNDIRQEEKQEKS